MTTIKHFEDIEAWKTARELTVFVYTLTDEGLFSRDFGLKDQIRRATVSIMSNIAEGFESQTQAQFVRYLGHAKASAGEVRSQLYVALDVKYLTKEQFDKAFGLADKAIRQIARFMAYLESHTDSRRISEELAEYNV
ncbi:MAG: four helix bundle protein [Chloroflexota bacterium]